MPVFVGGVNQSTVGNTVEAAEISSGAVGVSALSSAAKQFAQDHELTLYQALGSDVKAWSIPPVDADGSYQLVDQRLYLVPMWLPEDETLTGLSWAQTVQGSTTADNENRVGLYTTNGTTLTLVASCASDDDLWDDAAGIIEKDFSSTYAASAGVLYAGLLYSSSAEATPPEIASRSVLSGQYMDMGMPANVYRCHRLSSQTSLPSSVTLSATSENFSGIPSVGVY